MTIAAGSSATIPAKMIRGNTVADAARRDLLAEPHQEHGAADQRDHSGRPEEQAGIGHDITRAFKPDGDAVGLQRRQDDRAVTGVLVDLLAALLAFLLELLKMRRHGRHQLNDDRCRDVRHDVEREDRHAAKRAAGQHVEHAGKAALGLLNELGQLGRVDARDRNIGAEPVDQQRTQRKPDALLKIFGFCKGGKVDVCSQLFRS